MPPEVLFLALLAPFSHPSLLVSLPFLSPSLLCSVSLPLFFGGPRPVLPLPLAALTFSTCSALAPSGRLFFSNLLCADTSFFFASIGALRRLPSLPPSSPKVLNSYHTGLCAALPTLGLMAKAAWASWPKPPVPCCALVGVCVWWGWVARNSAPFLPVEAGVQCTSPLNINKNNCGGQ